MKKIFSVVFIASLLLVTSIFTNAVVFGGASDMLGDVFKDGDVNAKDAYLILRYCAKLDDEIDIAVADLTLDGKVTSRDALFALQVAAGLRDVPTTETPKPTAIDVDITRIPTSLPTVIPTMVPTPPATFCPEKPVIYLYPEVETEVSVKLDFNGKLTSTYPTYNNGWVFVAKPDGTLYDKETDREYYCLFWEGEAYHAYDFSEGFVVAGHDTKVFLENALDRLGLNAKEANEFIIYWLPRMEGNEYNLISFQNEVYTDNAKLDIEPAPDSILRVFMAYKEIDEPIDIEPQEFKYFERKGFTVVEWGGAECYD